MKRKRGRKKKPVAERKVAAMALRMLWEQGWISSND